MTLYELVDHFLYTHPVQHHQKQLLQIIRAEEEKYLQRIMELENELAIKNINSAPIDLEPKVEIERYPYLRNRHYSPDEDDDGDTRD